MALAKSQFKFKKHEFLGAEGAEEDKDFLRECFIDTGDLDVLRDISHPARIVVGRTGAGKTALLMHLRTCENDVSWIEPDELALQYISNSNVIKWLTELGVNLDIFYRLLWRHIFTIELVQLKYNIRNETDQRSFFEKIYQKYLGQKRKKEAFDYLYEWGNKFWEGTECRIHEVTKKLEKDIRAKLGSKFELLKGDLSGSKKISEEDRYEIVDRAQTVVNSVQIQKLSKVIDALENDEFTNKQKKFYIIIDRLDEKWVDDSIRYKLIKALIEAVRDLKKITTCKIIIALRKDLINRVFRHTRAAGFQEEKYQSLFLNLSWNKEEIVEVLNKRLNKLVRKQYTKKEITWKDIFAHKIGKQRTDDYLVDRTMYRPRDIINFSNCCIRHATGRAAITATMVKRAEAEYSDTRFRSLGDEWIADHPSLLKVLSILKRRPSSFDAFDITEVQIDEMILEILSNDSDKKCILKEMCQKAFDGDFSKTELRRKMINLMYRLGVIGIRRKNRVINWSFIGNSVLREAEIPDNPKIEICPMFYRILGIFAQRRKKH